MRNGRKCRRVAIGGFFQNKVGRYRGCFYHQGGDTYEVFQASLGLLRHAEGDLHLKWIQRSGLEVGDFGLMVCRNASPVEELRSASFM